MGQIHYIDGKWTDVVALSQGGQLKTNKVTVEDIIEEFNDNTKKIQAEYKKIKEQVPEDQRLGFIDSRVKVKLAEIVAKSRNSEFN